MTEIQVTYTESLDGQAGQQITYAYQVAAAWQPLDTPMFTSTHRLVHNLGPRPARVGLHPKLDRSRVILGPGQSAAFQGSGTLFAAAL